MSRREAAAPHLGAGDAAAAAASGLVGRRVGNYVIERPLARGGMGSVYVARHPALGREVAVKFLGGDLETSAELSARFLEEARLTASLRHPNIVDIFDFGELDGRCYYVMELLRGTDLGTLMRGRRFTADEVLGFVQQICSALEAAHSAGVVHRDLKPANVFALEGDEFRIKLMDFGVAKMLTHSDVSRTRRGQILGTPTHMSPEQALGQTERVGPRADLYSLGVMLHEMLTGRLPFVAESEVALILMHVNTPARSLTELCPDIPPRVAELVEQCLAKDPGSRPASARALADAFAAAVRDHGATDAGPAPARVVVRVNGGADAAGARTLAAQTGVRLARGPIEMALAATVAHSPTPGSPEPLATARGAMALGETAAHPAEPDGATPAPAAPASPSPVRGSDRKALQRLLERMQARGDFPAFVRNVTDISKRAEVHGDYSASQLSEAILRDYALTAKLLRVVNLAYGERFGRIHSVQSAVVVLGFERVRSIALSISVFKVPSRRGADAAQVDSAVSALVRGELARTLAARAGVADAEQAQVAALFRDLGRHLVLHYLPESQREIERLTEREGLAPTAAAERVLGMSYAALGLAIAERWRLPKAVLDAIGAPAAPPARIVTEQDRVSALAVLAEELCQALARAGDGDADAEAARVLARFEPLLKLHPRELPAVVQAVRTSLNERYATLLGSAGASSRVLQGAARVASSATTAPSHRPAAPAAAFEAAPAAPRPRPAVRRLALGRAPETEPHDPGGLAARVRALLAEASRPEELGSRVLELHVATLGFRRAILLSRAAERLELVARAAHGEDAEFLEKELRVTLGTQRSNDVFTVAWGSGRDLVVEDTHDPRNATRIPRWYFELVGSPVLVLQPCRAAGLTEALLFADRDSLEDLPDLRALEPLRQALAQGIARARPRAARP